MNASDNESRSAEHPRHTLRWAYDDEEHPTEVTVFDPGADITTHWITIDKESVWKLDETI